MNSKKILRAVRRVERTIEVLPEKQDYRVVWRNFSGRLSMVSEILEPESAKTLAGLWARAFLTGNKKEHYNETHTF